MTNCEILNEISVICSKCKLVNSCIENECPAFVLESKLSDEKTKEYKVEIIGFYKKTIGVNAIDSDDAIKMARIEIESENITFDSDDYKDSYIRVIGEADD